MNVCRNVLLVTVILGLAGCPKKDTDDEIPTAVAPATVAPVPVPTQATPTPTTALTVDESNPKIEARVKVELDGRTDGITGSPLAVSGAKASLQSPTGWQVTKGDVTVAASADNKAQVAATGFGPEGANGKLPTAVSALSLSNCQWGSTESLTVGKTKVAATAADGVCTRGTNQVRTAYVAPNAEGLLVVGAWESGGDSGNVFGSMRSIAKAAGGGDSSGIAACCAALSGNAKVAPPEQQGFYIAAAGMCNSLKASPDARAALAQVRGMLGAAGVPAACK